MDDTDAALREAKSTLATEKMLTNDNTENVRNTILVAILSTLRRIWRNM